MSSPIRVAHVVGSTGLYGAEQWILALFRYLPPDKVEGTLVNLVDDPGQVSEVVRVAKARGLEATDLYTGGRYNPRAIVRLARFVRERRLHILHSHGYKADLIALFAAKFSGARVVSTPHGWSREHDRQLMLYESLDRRLLRFFDCISPLSPDLRDGLQRCGVRERKVRMILNGVDIEEVDSVAPTVTREPAGTVIGYVGQLIRRKNVECLILAFHQLAALRDDVRLLIVGEGPSSEHLQELVSSLNLSRRVGFTGYRGDAIALMKTFDLFVLPSWEEGIPRCLMEAMAAGVPVVGSDIPGNRDLIEHEVTGLLFPPDSPERLQEAILSTVERPERAKDMAHRARAKIERRFSARRMADDYAALYDECSTFSS